MWLKRWPFNAATARLPWRTEVEANYVIDPDGLQCGHGSIAVENCATSPRTPQSADLQCGHGSIAVEKHDNPANDAPRPEPSMRPRLDCRGEGYGLPWVLRFGIYLQCGHGSIAVENQRLEHGVLIRRQAFNAATARLPWRMPASALDRRRVSSLQCGHGSIAVEK